MSKRRSRCEHCDELRDDVLESGGVKVCADCDETEYCNVCDEQMWPDDFCRHIFKAEGCVYGCGSGKTEYKYHKESFFAVLDKTKLSHEIKTALLHGKIETQYGGPIIGRGWYEFELSPDGQRETTTAYGDRFTDDLDGDEEYRMTVGVGWLDSLACADRPQAAVDVTVQWIEEWEAAQLRKYEFAWFHGTHPHTLRLQRLRNDYRLAGEILGGRPVGPGARLSRCGRYVGMRSESDGKPVAISRDQEFPYRSWGNLGDGNFDMAFGHDERIVRVFDRPIIPVSEIPPCVPVSEATP